MKAVFLRELKAYFNSLPAYIFIALMLAGGGSSLAVASECSTEALTDSLQYMLFIATPLITMRLGFGSAGLDRTLLCAPVSTASIVTGKYLAAAATLAFALAVSLIYPLLGMYTAWGETASAYLGLLFLGAALISVGVFVSSFALGRPAVGMLTLALMLLILLFQAVIPGISAPWLKALLTDISPSHHMHVFGSGIISFSSAVYFVSFSALFLLLSGAVIQQRRRW